MGAYDFTYEIPDNFSKRVVQYLQQIGNVNIANAFIRCKYEYEKVDLTGKHAVVLGRSDTVGKPMALLLLNANATVTVCHSKTQNLKEICKTADILVSAIGKANFVTEDMIKEGAIVIDVGMNRDEQGKLCGDVDFDRVAKKVSLITPVPGGVGPMTITMLLYNTVKSAELSL